MFQPSVSFLPSAQPVDFGRLPANSALKPTTPRRCISWDSDVVGGVGIVALVGAVQLGAAADHATPLRRGRSLSLWEAWSWWLSAWVVLRTMREAENGVVSEERRFHHAALPSSGSAYVLSGHTPPDEQLGWRSTSLQLLYNNTDIGWADPEPHAHAEADEIFVVLRGSLVVDVEGEHRIVGPREFCCFPRGLSHSIVEVRPPAETLMIRAPSVSDKIYRASGA